MPEIETPLKFSIFGDCSRVPPIFEIWLHFRTIIVVKKYYQWLNRDIYDDSELMKICSKIAIDARQCRASKRNEIK